MRYVLRGHSHSVNSVVFPLDGKLLASGPMNETVRIWDMEKGQELSRFKGNSCDIDSVAFSPDGSLIVLGSADRMVRLWNIVQGELRMLLDGHSGAVNSVRFSPNGKLIVSRDDDMTIKLWETITGTGYMTLKGHRRRIMAVTSSPGCSSHRLGLPSYDYQGLGRNSRDPNNYTKRPYKRHQCCHISPGLWSASCIGLVRRRGL